MDGRGDAPELNSRMLTRRALLVPQHGELSSEPFPVSLYRYRQTAMATGWEITLPGLAAMQMDLVDEAFSRLHDIESRLTVYRDESEVSSLNRLQSGVRVPITPDLVEVLGRCLNWWEMTGGAFDVACGRMIKEWGFFKGPASVPRPDATGIQPEANGMDKVDLDLAERTFRWKAQGVELNFGCVGKGFAVDAMAGILTTTRVLQAGLVQSGGSSARAWGVCPGEGQGWRVAVRHPWNADAVIAEVLLQDDAIGTSAGSYRHLIHCGRRLPHVLNPATAWPAAGMASVTVLAPEAMMADALSTAFFVLGTQKAGKLIGQFMGVTALFMEESGKIVVIGEQPARFHVCSV